MLTKPSDKELLALARIAKSDDGQTLLAYLKRCTDEAKDTAMALEAEPMIRRMQGRVGALKELVEALGDAPDLVLKLDNRAQRR